MYKAKRKAEFFTILKVGRILKNYTKAERQMVLTAVQIGFTDGWNACDNYRLKTGTIPVAPGVN